MGQPRPLFVYFRSLQTVGVSGIRTPIVREHAVHLTTTTTAHVMNKLHFWIQCFLFLEATRLLTTYCNSNPFPHLTTHKDITLVQAKVLKKSARCRQQ